jgi:hypothetical protein
MSQTKMTLSDAVPISGTKLRNSNGKRLAAITVHSSSTMRHASRARTVARSCETNSNVTATNTAIVATIELTP